jgi:hypothetical protein
LCSLIRVCTCFSCFVLTKELKAIYKVQEQKNTGTGRRKRGTEEDEEEEEEEEEEEYEEYEEEEEEEEEAE